jgi:8-oxo-dGTP pyrophosphatase MutT (NUDIX family)
MISLANVERVLSGRDPVLYTEEWGIHAAVALVLREQPQGPEVLFIERAPHENDPWSGNICFPGGKVDRDDGGAKEAAVRETLEEVGIDLSDAFYLGRLSDITGALRPIRVSCFVFGLRRLGSLTLNDEVSDAFWVPLTQLLDPERYSEVRVSFSGRTLLTPAIRLPNDGKPVLWGLTYRLLMEFLGLVRDRLSAAPI